MPGAPLPTCTGACDNGGPPPDIGQFASFWAERAIGGEGSRLSTLRNLSDPSLPFLQPTILNRPTLRRNVAELNGRRGIESITETSLGAQDGRWMYTAPLVHAQPITVLCIAADYDDGFSPVIGTGIILDFADHVKHSIGIGALPGSLLPAAGFAANQLVGITPPLAPSTDDRLIRFYLEVGNADADINEAGLPMTDGFGDGSDMERAAFGGTSLGALTSSRRYAYGAWCAGDVTAHANWGSWKAWANDWYNLGLP